MEDSNKYPQRKPNLNTWTCPICCQKKNSRGAPGHLRNKHGKTWKKVYLRHPELILERDNSEIINSPSPLEKFFFCGLDYRNNDKAKSVISIHSKFATEIRNSAIRKDDIALTRLEDLLKNAIRDYQHYISTRTDK